jgi:hypothetical protein
MLAVPFCVFEFGACVLSACPRRSFCPPSILLAGCVFIDYSPSPMTEALRSQPESELDPQVMRIWLTVCDGFSRYPVDLVVKTDLSWDQLMEAWYESASGTPHWEARK